MKRKRERTQQEGVSRIVALYLQRDLADRAVEEQTLAKVEKEVDAAIKDRGLPYSDMEADLLRRIARMRLQLVVMRHRGVREDRITSLLQDEMVEAMTAYLPDF